MGFPGAAGGPLRKTRCWNTWGFGLIQQDFSSAFGNKCGDPGYSFSFLLILRISLSTVKEQNLIETEWTGKRGNAKCDEKD